MLKKKKKKGKTQNGVSLCTKWLKKKSLTPNADEDEKKLNHLFNAGRNTKYK